MLNVAVHKYVVEGYSLAAAALAGISFDQMKEILAERSVVLRIGLETVQEAREELSSLRRMRS